MHSKIMTLKEKRKVLKWKLRDQDAFIENGFEKKYKLF